MASIHANGITIYYDSFGPQGSEAILLIAGLGAQMIRWSVPFCQEMAARGFRVIRFDNRDAGLSTHFVNCPTPEFGAISQALAQGRQPEAAYTLHDMTEDAIGLLDALSMKQTHLVGRSMGGMIAQLAASEHPHRVMSLASIMSSTGNPSLPVAAPDVMTMLTRQAPNPLEDESAFVAHSLAFARRIASPGYPFDEKANRALILEEIKRAYDPSGIGRQIAAIAVTGDNRSRLSKITVPTLVVHGADDPLVPLAAGKDTATSIHGAEFMVIEGMGHDLPPALYETMVDAITWNARR